MQILQRTSIAQRAGNPRRSLTNEFRGALLDASGAALAQTKGTRRVYPAGPALAQLVGYSSPLYGESGLEAALDSVLAAPLQASGGADVSDFFRRNGLTSTHGGGDVVLTLRADIAKAVDAALPPDVRGAAIVMDPRSGAILAAVNRPTFDPNALGTVWKTLRANPNSPLLDRAFAGLYPPGSTFKMVAASAALDSGVVVPTDTFVDPGYFDDRLVPRRERQARDHRHAGYGQRLRAVEQRRFRPDRPAPRLGRLLRLPPPLSRRRRSPSGGAGGARRGASRRRRSHRRSSRRCPSARAGWRSRRCAWRSSPRRSPTGAS